jgi:hypothetical protein
VEIEFDPAKDERNRRDRGLPLILAVQVLANLVIEFQDNRRDYGEQRMIAFGLIGPRLHCLVYTTRGATIRPISLRKANRKEIDQWHPSPP